MMKNMHDEQEPEDLSGDLLLCGLYGTASLLERNSEMF